MKSCALILTNFDLFNFLNDQRHETVTADSDIFSICLFSTIKTNMSQFCIPNADKIKNHFHTLYLNKINKYCHG